MGLPVVCGGVCLAEPAGTSDEQMAEAIAALDAGSGWGTWCVKHESTISLWP